LNDGQYLVPRMTREQRKEAIEGPLGRVEIAASLVQRMLNDAGDEPDQLPILQHALMRTWSHRRTTDRDSKRPIELQDYEGIAGFNGALNLHADELLAGVPYEIAEPIFKRLTARGRGNRERREPARLAELWAVCGAETPERQAQVTAVIDHFRRGEATFLTPRDGPIGPDTYIDITHESLIRQWKKLREEWLPEEQLSAKTFLDLTDRARNWKANKGELLAGLDLTGAVEWDRRRNKSPAWAEHYADETASRAVHEFITASQANERWRVFRRWAQWIAPLLLVVGAAGFVWYERDQRRHRAAQDALFRAQTELLRRVEFEKEATLGNAERVLREAELARIESQLATAGRVDTSVAPSPGTGSSAPTRPPAPRVYVQVRSQADAGDVTTGLIPRLQKAGFVVPKPEVLSTGPTSPEVRFFRSDEREDAGRIAQILQQAGIPDAQVRYVAGYEKSDRIRQKHFEVWLAPRDDGIRVPPVVGQSVQSANAMIARLGLRPKAEFNSIGRYAPNTIFGQQPREGSIVEGGGVIHLYVEMELRPNELAAGRLFLSPTEVIDLDREAGTRLSWDVGLRTSGAGFYLEFGNGAQGVFLPGATRRATAFDATLCRTATDFTSRVQIPEPVAGQTVCAKTSLGRIAAIQLVELAKEPPELTIRYSTLRR
jgi:PASTA domain